MTVIAYDGRCVAADKQSTSEGLRSRCTKLFVRGRKVYAVNGTVAHGMVVLAWIEAGANPADFPRAADEMKSAHVHVFETGKHVHSYENYPAPIIEEGPLYASGHGRDFALMAMHLGKTAKEAVELTSVYDVFCGMGVDVVDLHEIAAAYDKLAAVRMIA